MIADFSTDSSHLRTTSGLSGFFRLELSGESSCGRSAYLFYSSRPAVRRTWFAVGRSLHAEFSVGARTVVAAGGDGPGGRREFRPAVPARHRHHTRPFSAR